MMGKRPGKTGGGAGTNQHGVKGRSVQTSDEALADDGPAATEVADDPFAEVAVEAGPAVVHEGDIDALTCDRCEGVGYFEEEWSCGTCEGEGEVEDDEGETESCYECSGDGADVDEWDCDDCDGEGHVATAPVVRDTADALTRMNERHGFEVMLGTMCCQSCSFANAKTTGRDGKGRPNPGYRPFVGFHQQDVEGAKGGLLLFHDATDEDLRTLVAGLEDEGFEVEWDGSHDTRIQVR